MMVSDIVEVSDSVDENFKSLSDLLDTENPYYSSDSELDISLVNGEHSFDTAHQFTPENEHDGLPTKTIPSSKFIELMGLEAFKEFMKFKECGSESEYCNVGSFERYKKDMENMEKMMSQELNSDQFQTSTVNAIIESYGLQEICDSSWMNENDNFEMIRPEVKVKREVLADITPQKHLIAELDDSSEKREVVNDSKVHRVFSFRRSPLLRSPHRFSRIFSSLDFQKTASHSDVLTTETENKDSESGATNVRNSFRHWIWKPSEENKENEVVECVQSSSESNQSFNWKSWKFSSEESSYSGESSTSQRAAGDENRHRFADLKTTLHKEKEKFKERQKDLKMNSIRSFGSIRGKLDDFKQGYHSRHSSRIQQKDETRKQVSLREIKSIFNRQNVQADPDTSLFVLSDKKLDNPAGKLKVVENRLKLKPFEPIKLEDNTTWESALKQENISSDDVLRRMRDGTIKPRHQI